MSILFVFFNPKLKILDQKIKIKNILFNSKIKGKSEILSKKRKRQPTNQNGPKWTDTDQIDPGGSK